MAKPKILAVDDSPTELKLVLEAIDHARFDVSSATDGEDALNKAQLLRPDLMLLDVVLPKKNGFQVCRQLKTAPDTKDIKIILVTSKSQDTDRFWGLKQGADAYLTKPFDSAELNRLIETTL